MLLPWLCDVAFEEMNVLFLPRISAQTLMDNGSLGAAVFEGGDW